MDEVLEGRSATDAKNRYVMLKPQPFFLLLRRPEQLSAYPIVGCSYTILQRSKQNRHYPRGTMSSIWNRDNAIQEDKSSASSTPDKWSSDLTHPMDNTSHRETFIDQSMCVDHTLDSPFMQYPGSGYGFHGESISLPKHEEFAMMQPPARQTMGTSSVPVMHDVVHHSQEQLMREVPALPPSSSNRALFGWVDPSLPGNLTDSHMETTGGGVETPDFLQTTSFSVRSAEYFGGSLETLNSSAYPEKMDEEVEGEWEANDEDGEEENEEEEEEEDEEEEEEEEEDNANGQHSKQDHSVLPTVSLGDQSSGNDRKSTMVLQRMQPDLVGQVLALLLSSKSPVDIKIFSQDSED